MDEDLLERLMMLLRETVHHVDHAGMTKFRAADLLLLSRDATTVYFKERARVGHH